MTTDLNALMDAQCRLDWSRIDEIAHWILALEGTALGDALSQQQPMTIRLCAAQTYAFLAIQAREHMGREVVYELMDAALEARMEEVE